MSQDDGKEDVREAIDQSASGAPAAGEAVRDMFSADEIFQRIVASANAEIDSSGRELFFSGLAAGFAITLTFLLHAVLTAAVPNDRTHLLGSLLYPVGFVYIIMGRYQLYTENTLPPVALTLTRVISVPSLLRVWGVVLVANVTGAALGAFVLAHSGVMTPEVAKVGAEFASKAVETPWWDLFFKAVFAGWLVAGLVWLLHASRDSVTRFVLVFVIFLCIPVAELYHVVVSTCDAFYYVFEEGAAVLPVLWDFVFPVLLGNTVGGVFLVTLVNYAQTQRRIPGDEHERRVLGYREWLLGGIADRGRSGSAQQDD
ncbi:formate/nitrite transporter family protein [Halomarina halobia]|uniref:Formate/nitrite transporter family protein n=1 Tax=Halomarina halobia TaxID=3033386 RepID=A0ABD6A5B8_9EURY|nr:formate/nitrite transporter family protein [Halomarina sp. PSR21]